MKTPRNLAILGTHSGVGKNTIACGIIRRLTDVEKLAILPFKAYTIEDYYCSVSDGVYMAFSQAMQCAAARIPASPLHSPLIVSYLKNELVVLGKPRSDPLAVEGMREVVSRALDELMPKGDMIVAEGSGCCGEMGVTGDLSNEFVGSRLDARVVIVGDLSRGGAFAHLHGTLALMPRSLRENVIGVVLNKWGTGEDDRRLQRASSDFFSTTGVRVLGTVEVASPDMLLSEETSADIPADVIEEHEIGRFSDLVQNLDWQYLRRALEV